MRPVLLLFMSSVAVFAQPFSFGVKAGVPLSDFISAASNSEFNYTAPMQRYIVGGTAEVRLPIGFSIEFDALYRHLQLNGTAIGILPALASQASAGNWEFPLLLKYRFHFPVVRPYIDGGVAWDTLTGLSTAAAQADGILTGDGVGPHHNTTAGVVLGGGVDIHALFMHISPELRYTHWTAVQVSDTLGLVHSNQNQAEFLVGFTF
jgi:hypothetical protein